MALEKIEQMCEELHRLFFSCRNPGRNPAPARPEVTLDAELVAKFNALSRKANESK